MKKTTILRRLCLAAAALGGCAALNANAAIYYGGAPKGFPGDAVTLTINAAAGTTVQSLDILPELADVATVLTFVSLTPTIGLTGGGTGECLTEVCAFFYLPSKTFAVDTLLATFRFDIAPGAPVGPVAFDPGLLVDGELLPIPFGAGLEVLAIPEPATSALLLAGLVGLGAIARRKSRL